MSSKRNTNARRSHEPPRFPSHYRPRSREGRRALLLFLVLFALTQPPAVIMLANRIRPTISGLPFLYAYLLVLYVLLIAVLIWARTRNV